MERNRENFEGELKLKIIPHHRDEIETKKLQIIELCKFILSNNFFPSSLAELMLKDLAQQSKVEVEVPKYM